MVIHSSTSPPADNPVIGAYNKASKKHGYLNSIVSTASDTFGAATNLARFPRAFHHVNAAANIFIATDLLFAPVRLGLALRDFVKEVSPIKKVKAGLESVKEIATIGLDTLGLLGALQTFGAALPRALSLATQIGPYLVPFLFITLPFSLHDTYAVNTLRLDLQREYKRPEKLSSVDERIVNVTRGLGFVEKQHESLKDRLSLSKKSELKERAATLLKVIQANGEQKEAAVERAEAFMNTLRGRVRTVTALEVMGSVTGVATLGLVLASFAVPPVAPPVVPVLLMASGLSSLGQIALKALLLKKNPF